MKRFLVIALGALALTGCGISARLHQKQSRNPYVRPLFYERYLNPANGLDQQIQATVNALRANPRSATLHNQLGQLLAQKGFPKDAEAEFERAVNADRSFYPAWYNLGLLRSARGDYMGSRIAFGRTIHYKPGHAAALFQRGLLEERRGNSGDAIADYAKAFSINRALLDVKVNPQILDSKLIALALMKAYPDQHTREALLFQETPAGYGKQVIAVSPPAGWPTPATDQIVTPATPGTEPSGQTPPPNPPPPNPPPHKSE
jgi:tetratricopeptide (TPR) repeat protein